MITGNKIFKKAVKIVSLTIGLTAGLVLLAKFWLDGRYDRWMTDSDRIYAIVSKYSQREGEEPTLGSNVSGGVAPLLKTYSPDVEVASRLTLTGWGSGIKVFAEGRDEPVEASEAALSDEYWFDIFDTDILAGDPKQILTEIGSAMVSRSFNERAGGDLVGKQIWWDEMPDLKFTVKGIYEDFPLTTSARFDIMISLPSISLIMWDGSMNLFGNDRYMGVVKLRDGASPDELNELILSLEKRMPEYQELLDAGIDFTYAVTPLKDLHLSDSSLRSTRLVILLLGIVLVLVGTLNYILVMISSYIDRSKGMAMRKCFGAGKGNIVSLMMKEVSADIIVSLLLGTLLVFSFMPQIEALMSLPVSSMAEPSTIAVLVAVVLGVILLCSVIPGMIYANVPLDTAFRMVKEQKAVWKQAILFFEFVLMAAVMSLLIVITLQYRHLNKEDLGYDTEDIVYVQMPFGDSYGQGRSAVLMSELGSLTCVEAVAGGPVPLNMGYGNNITIPGHEDAIINISDLYYATSGWFGIMGVDILEGADFSASASVPEDVMVDENLAEQIRRITGWEDILGRTVNISEHGTCRITGVFRHITVGNGLWQDRRGQIVTYYPNPTEIINIKVADITPENLAAIKDVVDGVYPDKDNAVHVLPMAVRDSYMPVLRYRNTALAGVLILLLITLAGLIGYVSDESNRRRGELAIRKVYGASEGSLQSLFIVKIMRLAGPAVLVGACAVFPLEKMLLTMVMNPIRLGVQHVIYPMIAVLLIVAAVCWLQTYRASRRNPSDNLHNAQ